MILSYILFLIILITDPINCLAATAWLPAESQYKYTVSFSTIDHSSRKLISNCGYTFSQIELMLHILANHKAEILDTANQDGRGLTDKELHALDCIRMQQEKLTEFSNKILSFSEHRHANFAIEYGIDNNCSLGIKISQTRNRLIYHNLPSALYDYNYPWFRRQYLPVNNFSPAAKNRLISYVNNIDIFYKYKIYDDSKFIISLQPRSSFSYYVNKRNPIFYDLSLLAGYTEQKGAKQKPIKQKLSKKSSKKKLLITTSFMK